MFSFFNKPTFIVYSWPYSEEVGGFMALHNLCHLIRKCGYSAHIWPAGLPLSSVDAKLQIGSRIWKNRQVPNIEFRTNPTFDTPIAAPQDLPGSIIIYPEVVEGNPLNGKKIVRWFLNRPGKLTGKINFSEKELSFFFQEAFNDSSINPNAENKLQLFTILDEVFKQTQPTEGRSGQCYILRKGKERAPKPSELDGPVIDNLPHDEIAKIFNNSEYCISYDSYTMYTVYAAMCGCKVIIVPEPGIEKNVWQPAVELTYGLAYGWGDLSWAQQTKELMIEHYRKAQNKNVENVLEFIKKCKIHFQ